MSRLELKLTRTPRTARQIALEAGCHRLTVYRWIACRQREGLPTHVTFLREARTGPAANAYSLPRGVLRDV